MGGHTTAARFRACIDEWRDCPQVGFELATLIGLKPMMAWCYQFQPLQITRCCLPFIDEFARLFPALHLVIINFWFGRTRCKATIRGAQSSGLGLDGIFLLQIYLCRCECRWFASAFAVAIIGSHITITPCIVSNCRGLLDQGGA